jgi:hypothetical protein
MRVGHWSDLYGLVWFLGIEELLEEWKGLIGRINQGGNDAIYNVDLLVGALAHFSCRHLKSDVSGELTIPLQTVHTRHLIFDPLLRRRYEMIEDSLSREENIQTLFSGEKDCGDAISKLNSYVLQLRQTWFF